MDFLGQGKHGVEDPVALSELLFVIIWIGELRSIVDGCCQRIVAEIFSLQQTVRIFSKPPRTIASRLKLKTV
jgi:hypothetical protein